MPLIFNLREGLMETKLHGAVTAEDLLRLDQLAREADSRLEASPNRILDISDATWGLVNSELVRSMAAIREREPMKNHVKAAIVAPKPEQYGIARMFQALDENPALEIQIFKDAPSAYEWLGRKQPA
jgi:NAD(P)H-flavin reductase